MIDQKQVAGYVEEILRDTDKFLVEILVQPTNRVTVFFDGDSEVSISDCRSLSRKLEEQLDREHEDYELIVSSHGLDRPIAMPRQYLKRIGKELDVKLISGERLSGILTRADGKSIELAYPVKNPKKEIQKPNTVIELDKIKSAKIIISFGK